MKLCWVREMESWFDEDAMEDEEREDCFVDAVVVDSVAAAVVDFVVVVAAVAVAAVSPSYSWIEDCGHCWTVWLLSQ